MGLTVEKCLQAWTNSLRQMNAKADIVFFGDSLTYYGDFASVFPDKVVCNLGLRGDTIQGMIDRVELVRMLKPEQVFLMAGINDVANRNSDDFESLYEELLSRMMVVLPNTDIIIQSMLPVNDIDFTISCSNKQILDKNIIIHDLAERYKLVFFDLFRLFGNKGYLLKNMTNDGIHLTSQAYKEWYSFLEINLIKYIV